MAEATSVGGISSTSVESAAIAEPFLRTRASSSYGNISVGAIKSSVAGGLLAGLLLGVTYLGLCSARASTRMAGRVAMLRHPLRKQGKRRISHQLGARAGAFLR